MKSTAKLQKIFDISPLFTTKNFQTLVLTAFSTFKNKQLAVIYSKLYYFSTKW